MRFTSVLAMHFDIVMREMRNYSMHRRVLEVISAVLYVVLLHCPTMISAETIERIVIIVDNEVVLMTEFEEAVRSANSSGKQISRGDVIDQMVNRIILLREAKKFGLKRKSEGREGDDALIKEFVDKRIRSFIHIPFGQIEKYYNEHDDFKDRDYFDVKDEIEKLMVSRELVHRLRDFVEEERRKSYIRIQLEE